MSVSESNLLRSNDNRSLFKLHRRNHHSKTEQSERAGPKGHQGSARKTHACGEGETHLSRRLLVGSAQEHRGCQSEDFTMEYNVDVSLAKL